MWRVTVGNLMLTVATSLAILDAENHDSNENGAEDDKDDEVNGYSGFPGESAAKVAGAVSSEASVNAACVAVRQLLCVQLQAIVYR